MPASACTAFPITHRRGERRGEVERRALPRNGLPARQAEVAPQQDPGHKRRADVNEVEIRSRPRAAEHRRAAHAEKKAGAGVVAEREQLLGFLPCDLAASVQLRDRPRADRIPAQQS